MMVLAETLTESFPAVAESVPVARNAVTAFAAAAGVTEEQLESVRLAASEALTNAALHAYRGEPGRIHVTAAVASGELWVLIADDGRGLQTASGSKGRGLGMALMAIVADSFTIARRSTGGVEVRLAFKLDTSAPEPSDQLRGSSASASVPASSRFSTTT
jgi:anti-sigma regulatory factor (Ser/Thr protein kinase)